MRIPALGILIALSAAIPAVPAPAIAYTVKPLALPGASERGIAMDYLVFDPATHMLWVPAGNTGAVDVVDTATGKIRQISGLPTAEIQNGERKRVVGPSSATVGAGTVYVGNRADSSICAFGSRTLTAGKCGHVASMPDAVSYIANTKEVWTTTPRDQSIRILDAAALSEKAKIVLPGDPEGYAVDAKRGRFYTNLEDKDQTLAIDVRTRKVAETWKSGCGEAGPRGLLLSPGGDYLFVACTDKVETLDLRHHGSILATVPTGQGVDSIAYSPQSHRLYAGAGKTGDLTIIDVDAAGHLKATATVTTAPGARNGVLATNDTLYLAHSPGSELLAVTAGKK
jgi:DNA-binding beta-propeller fold protein YncE